MPKGEKVDIARAARDPEKLRQNINAARAKHCAKQNRKLINSLKYISEHMPEPMFPGKTVGPANHVWPKVTALTGGRTLSREEVENLTLRLITAYECGRPMGIHAFAVRLKPFLPSSITLNPNWFDTEDRLQDEKAHEAIQCFREWYNEYMGNIESELLKYYMMHGEKFGKQYLTVLERRFRSNWAVNSVAYQTKVAIATESKPTEEEGTTEKTNKVEFVFTTIDPNREVPNA